MTALIVDDEPIARNVLREGLDLIPEVRVVGEPHDGEEALRVILELRTDVVFLDLPIPVMSSFEVLRRFSGPALPVIVVVAAFDQHAIEAFEGAAVDYLLDPVILLCLDNLKSDLDASSGRGVAYTLQLLE